MNRLDKRTNLEKRVELTFSRAETGLTVLGSKTIDTNLGNVYSKTGLVDATADKFAEQHGVEINDEDIKHEYDTNKNTKYGKSSETGSFTAGCYSLEQNYQI